MPESDTEAVREAFGRLESALQSGSESGFVSLCVMDAPPQLGVFRRNSERMRKQGLALRAERIEILEDVAELHFAVLDAEKRAVDQGRATFSREPAGWRLRAL